MVSLVAAQAGFESDSGLLPPPPPPRLHKTKTNSSSSTLSADVSGTWRSLSRPSSTQPSPSLETWTITETLSASIRLPVFPPRIQLVSSASIPATCITDALDTAVDQRCRTVVFAMTNDGFDFDSADTRFRVSHFLAREKAAGEPLNDGIDDTDATSAAAVALAVAAASSLFNASAGGIDAGRIVPARISLPFGVTNLWDQVIYASTVTVNVTHLAIQLGLSVGLDVVDPVPIVFNFTGLRLSLRDEEPVGRRSFTVVITPARAPLVPPGLRASSVVASIVGAAPVTLPLISTIADTQILLLGLSSVCFEPSVRNAALLSIRAVFPAIGSNSISTVSELAAGLLQNVGIMTVVGTAQIAFVYVLSLRREQEGRYALALATIYCPSLTLAAGTLLHSGIAFASFRILFAPQTADWSLLVALFGAAGCVGTSVVPPLLYDKVFSGVSRSHELCTAHFPALLRVGMASSSWGPKLKIRPWVVPFGPVGPNGLRFINLHLTHNLLHAIVRAVDVRSRGQCGVVIGLHLLILVAHIAVLFYRMPYRAPLSNWLAALSSVVTMLPFSLSLVHVAQPDIIMADNTERAAIVALSLTTLWSVANAVNTWFESNYITPVVWKRDKALGSTDVNNNDDPLGGQGGGEGKGEEDRLEFQGIEELIAYNRKRNAQRPADGNDHARANGDDDDDAAALQHHLRQESGGPDNVSPPPRRRPPRRNKLVAAPPPARDHDDDHQGGGRADEGGCTPVEGSDDDGGDDPDDESFLYFGPVGPEEATIQRYHAVQRMIVNRAKEQRAMWGESGRAREPMVALLKGEGAMPPHLRAAREKDYRML